MFGREGWLFVSIIWKALYYFIVGVVFSASIFTFHSVLLPMLMFTVIFLWDAVSILGPYI